MNTILVAGIGNVFLGDDGFGVEVVRRLQTRLAAGELPALAAGVSIADFGIRGIDLCYALLDGVDSAILIDATQRGGAPGTLYVIEPSLQEPAGAEQNDPYAVPVLMSPHEMDPLKVLQTLRMLGGGCENVVVLGCEPQDFGCEDGNEGRMGLSRAVEAAVEPAADVVVRLVTARLERLSALSA
ncbi:Hydrogenase 2 maturation protease [Paraburkholderia ultramafica]|uniref:Hydrogenase 2 maturation protease n=1 Tax=Paraburkholderia ultramafica TaxID=1544867 RepID=A0A6S7AXC9_9BURK|nr:hydrogenase maturation protease [Paraburkholderia ultramafica]CAB3780152.1 Hydrogenase 2 maturation protease [Paraburkholderia ultramafica]